MAKIINLLQGAPAWHQWRRWKIGASMSAAILGISPYQSKLQCWESIVLDEKTIPNYAMERGTRLEDTARQWLNNLRPHQPPYMPVCVEHDTIPWMIASLDGAILNWIGGSEIKEAAEIKLNGREAHSMALNGEIPPHHYSQLQHQMVVANLQRISYVSFDGDVGCIVEVKRDDEYITKKLMPALADFYLSLIDFKPPEPTDKDLIEITNLDALKMAREYSEIQMTIKQLEEKLEPLKEQLCGYATHGRCKIGELKVTKFMRRGNIDFPKYMKDNNINIPDSYRKENSVGWKIT